jgi:hypothetical protein
MVMVAYSFQKQFVPAIISGKKRQTIRAFGKRRHAYVGEPIQLYVGMRTKQCAKIIPDQICNFRNRVSKTQEKVHDGDTSLQRRYGKICAARWF